MKYCLISVIKLPIFRFSIDSNNCKLVCLSDSNPHTIYVLIALVFLVLLIRNEQSPTNVLLHFPQIAYLIF